jgi:hypothetical protein
MFTIKVWFEVNTLHVRANDKEALCGVARTDEIEMDSDALTFSELPGGTIKRDYHVCRGCQVQLVRLVNEETARINQLYNQPANHVPPSWMTPRDDEPTQSQIEHEYALRGLPLPDQEGER